MWFLFSACSDGDYYEGGFDHGFLRGDAKITYADGGYYEGQVDEGKRHGVGVYTLPNGTVQAGWFENGEYIGATKPAGKQE